MQYDTLWLVYSTVNVIRLSRLPLLFLISLVHSSIDIVRLGFGSLLLFFPTLVHSSVDIVGLGRGSSLLFLLSSPVDCTVDVVRLGRFGFSLSGNVLVSSESAKLQL
jgi:hypothetical protein